METCLSRLLIAYNQVENHDPTIIKDEEYQLISVKCFFILNITIGHKLEVLTSAIKKNENEKKKTKKLRYIFKNTFIIFIYANKYFL